MKKSLNKFIKGYMEVLYALSSVFYIGFCFCVLVQVISRNFLPNAPSWTEELARYSFIYMVAFGVGLAALKHEFVNEPKYCFPAFAMNSTATNISMKYIYFSQFLTFIILPVSYLLDIVRTALSWNDTAEKED